MSRNKGPGSKVEERAQLLLRIYALERVEKKHLKLMKERERNLALHRIISNISTGFINLATDRVDREIEQALEQLAVFLDMDSGAVFEFSRHDSLLRLTHAYAKDDEAVPALFQFVMDALPWDNFSNVKPAEGGPSPEPADHPDVQEARSNGEIPETHLAIPMPYGEFPTGVLAFGNSSGKGQWPDDLVKRLQPVGHIFSRALERRRTDETMRENEKKLSQQNFLLEQKNIALREVMAQVEKEKKRLEEMVIANVDKLLMPIVSKLRQICTGEQSPYLDLIEKNISSLTSSFGSNISKPTLGLTQREVEISNLIRNGLSNKEIGGLLNISHKSVETHRNHIRKKLGIVNKNVNLAAYLMNSDISLT